MGVPFIVASADIDEHLSGEPREVVMQLAKRKALAVAEQYPKDDILAADDLLAESKEERGRVWAVQQSIPTDQMVVIGDTLHDLAAARYIGADCILCAIGHQSESDLLTGGVPVVRSFRELEPLLL